MTAYDRYFVGYDKFAEKLERIAGQALRATNYPPYNVRKIDENKYSIELAVAGFGKQDIDIELADSKLVIKGALDKTSEEGSLLWKGISSKSFTTEFSLSDTIEVSGASLINGILKIGLEALIPEKPATQKINIDGE